MDEPRLRCWMQDPVPPRTYYDERPGRWVAEERWPSPRIVPTTFHLNREGLQRQPGQPARLEISSPLTVGMMAGAWCAYGLQPDQSGDQRNEAGGSLVFDSEPLTDDVDILGAPVIEIDLDCDCAQGMVAVCLSEVLADGAATRVSYGLLNLTHRDSHEFPEPLEPGKVYRVRVQLNDAGHRFGAGNRIRVAISSSYWPIAWPSPRKTTLGIAAASSVLLLPVRPGHDADKELRPFESAQCSPPLDKTVQRESDFRWIIEHDMKTALVKMNQFFDEGRVIYNEHDGWTIESSHDEYFTIHPDEPNSARLDITWTERFERDDWWVSSRTNTVFTSTETHFLVTAKLEAWEGDELAYSQRWEREFARNQV